MTYFDRFVAAVPTANREIYKKHAEAAAIVFKEHGALKLVECWGDDVPEGKVTSFSMEVKCKDDGSSNIPFAGNTIRGMMTGRRAVERRHKGGSGARSLSAGLHRRERAKLN
jgi:uncharacterized protein YbaA (DUF1428 family)